MVEVDKLRLDGLSYLWTGHRSNLGAKRNKGLGMEEGREKGDHMTRERNMY